MMLSDVCLYVASIGSNSRTERPRKTKTGTEVAHVTRDSDTTFKVKRSRSPTHRRVGASGSCSGGRGNVLAAINCSYVCCRMLGRARRFGAHGGEEGRGISWRPPAYSLFLSNCENSTDFSNV